MEATSFAVGIEQPLYEHYLIQSSQFCKGQDLEPHLRAEAAAPLCVCSRSQLKDEQAGGELFRSQACVMPAQCAAPW